MSRKKFAAAPDVGWEVRWATAIASLALSCVIAAPSSAFGPEPPVASPLPMAADQVPIEAGRPILAAFGKCNVRKNPALAREFILTNRNYSLDERFRSLVLPDCVAEAMQGGSWGTAQLQFTTPVLWYIVADALVSRDLKKFNPDILRTSAPLSELTIEPAKMRIAKGHPATDVETAQNLAAAKIDIAIVKYGECVVRSDPHSSQTLLASKINSNEEEQALTALLPAFRGCLDEGHQFEASRLNLRGTVAFNYYRLAYAPQVASAAKP